MSKQEEPINPARRALIGQGVKRLTGATMYASGLLAAGTKALTNGFATGEAQAKEGEQFYQKQPSRWRSVPLTPEIVRQQQDEATICLGTAASMAGIGLMRDEEMTRRKAAQTIVAIPATVAGTHEFSRRTAEWLNRSDSSKSAVPSKG